MINHFQNCKGKKESISTETTIPNSEEKSLHAETFLYDGSKKVENQTYMYFLDLCNVAFFLQITVHAKAGIHGREKISFHAAEQLYEKLKAESFCPETKFHGVSVGVVKDYLIDI